MLLYLLGNILILELNSHPMYKEVNTRDQELKIKIKLNAAICVI